MYYIPKRAKALQHEHKTEPLRQKKEFCENKKSRQKRLACKLQMCQSICLIIK